MNESPVPVGWWEFFNPGRLWWLLAVLALAVAYIVLLQLKRNRGMRYTQTGIVGAVLPRQSQWRRHVAVAATLASLVAIIGAYARPAGEEQVPRERATVAIILDRSMSMQSKDVEPNRFEASKQAALTFVDSLPAQYNISVIGMSGTPQVLVPPTTDRPAVKRGIELMEMADGTAVGDAIVQGLTAISAAPGEEGAKPAPGLIVMLSDGQSTSGKASPQEGAAQAKQAGVPVYTVAYGTMNGYVDIDGKRENVAPDVATMREISNATDAQSLTADSASELKNVYERMRSEVTYETVKKEVTARWAMYALAFAVVASLGAVSMAARWP